jgi:hypothetical protein
MLVTRKSIASGKTRTRDLPITELQMFKFNSGELAQDAFPNLSDSDREFIMTGVTDDEWNMMFPEDDFERDEPAF